MTQACLRRASVVIPGTERCDLNGEEEDESGECSGSINQQEHQLTEAGHSGENSKMHKIQEKIQEGLERTIRYVIDCYSKLIGSRVIANISLKSTDNPIEIEAQREH